MDALNLVTLLSVVILKFSLAGVLLWRTHTWTWLGRGLLLMFLIFGIVYSLPFLRLVGLAVPYWATLAIRIVAIVDCALILGALINHDWEEPASGIQWAKLLGLKK